MNQTFFLLIFFVGLVGLLWKMGNSPGFKRWFRFLPVPLWCYLLPMIGTSLGWLPREASLYHFFSEQLLPVCLVLLLIGTDLKALLGLGPLATVLFFAGAVGTIVGGLVSFKLYHHWLPDGTWGGIGALCASWIGGSANMMAVKEALRVPDSIIGSLVIIDAVVAYSWMALLIWASGWQDRWDKLIAQSLHPRSSATCSGAGILRPLVRPGVPDCAKSKPSLPRLSFTGDKRKRGPCPLRFPIACSPRIPRVALLLISIVGGAIILSLGAQWIARRLPMIGVVMNPVSWTILLVTTITLVLSVTPLSKVEEAGASRMGTFLLFVLLASIGARGDLSAIFHAPAFLILGLTWIAIHGWILFLTGYLLRAPLGLIAAASQANIGGTISAPLVGAAYHPQLASMGLLMAILGNILGTYLGLATATITHFFS